MNSLQELAELLLQVRSHGRLRNRTEVIAGLEQLMANKRNLQRYVGLLPSTQTNSPLLSESVADENSLLERFLEMGLRSASDEKLVTLGLSRTLLLKLFEAIEHRITSSPDYSPWRQIYQQEFERLISG